jgi:RNA recognition motif-containing protein
MSSWTQVYVSGLPKTKLPEDERLEQLLQERYHLVQDELLTWAGQGSTVVKRSQDSVCRGYCFLAFLTQAGAQAAVKKINTDSQFNDKSVIKAELSQPKTKKAFKSNVSSDIRLRRYRAPPAPKHPVLKSSAPKKK